MIANFGAIFVTPSSVPARGYLSDPSVIKTRVNHFGRNFICIKQGTVIMDHYHRGDLYK